MSLSEVLNQSTVDDVLALKDRSRVVSVLPETTVSSAFQSLGRGGFVSAPVIASKQNPFGKQPGDFLGIVDVTDFMDQLMSDSMASFKGSDEKGAGFETNPHTMHRTERIFWDRDISSLFDACKTVMSVSHTGTPLKRLLKDGLLVPQPGGNLRLTHQLAILNNRGKVTAFLTQGDILRYVVKYIDCLGNLKHQPLEQISEIGGKGPVFTVPVTMTAGNAFRVLNQYRISCVGVVDSQGILVENLSASDFTHLGTSNFSTLFHPVGEFLRTVRAASRKFHHYSATNSESLVQRYQDWEKHEAQKKWLASPEAWFGQTTMDPRHVRPLPHQAHSRNNIVQCSTKVTFGELISVMTSSGLHRIYITDNKGRPVGIATVTDVLKVLERRAR